MKNFQHCIWHLPQIFHPWYYLENGFIPHMSIATNLTLTEAKNLLEDLPKTKIKIKLCDEIKTSNEEEFHAAYCNLKFPRLKIPWWPKKPHISFLYQYNQKFTIQQLTDLQNKLVVKDATLEEFKIMRCSGHFSTWREIKIIQP